MTDDLIERLQRHRLRLPPASPQQLTRARVAWHAPAPRPLPLLRWLAAAAGLLAVIDTGLAWHPRAPAAAVPPSLHLAPMAFVPPPSAPIAPCTLLADLSPGASP